MRGCEVCGCETHAIYDVELGELRRQMLQCPGCKCCQLETPFPEDALTAFYRSEYFAQLTFDQVKGRLLARDYYTKCRRYIEAFKGESCRVLEIGAGFGHFSGMLSHRYQADVSVVEISEKCVEYIKEHYPKIRIYPVPIGEISKGELGKFDFVFSGHCVEHLQTFQEYFEALGTLLKPGGVGIVLTPNALSATFTRFRQAWEWCAPEQHFQFLSTAVPSEFFAKYGLELVKITSVAPAPIHCPRDWVPAWVSRLMRLDTPYIRQQLMGVTAPTYISGQSLPWRTGKEIFHKVLPLHVRKVVIGWIAGTVSRTFGPAVRDELMIVVRRG